MYPAPHPTLAGVLRGSGLERTPSSTLKSVFSFTSRPNLVLPAGASRPDRIYPSASSSLSPSSPPDFTNTERCRRRTGMWNEDDVKGWKAGEVIVKSTDDHPQKKDPSLSEFRDIYHGFKMASSMALSQVRLESDSMQACSLMQAPHMATSPALYLVKRCRCLLRDRAWTVQLTADGIESFELELHMDRSSSGCNTSSARSSKHGGF